MKKRKSLNRKIQRLKARLAKDAKKLAKLTIKLAAATTGGIKGRRKSVTRVRKAPASAEKAAGSKRRVPMKPAAAVQKPRRKLNLTPERRAQLAEAMKARWVAKRAAAAANSQSPSGDQGLSAGDGSQP